MGIQNTVASLEDLTNAIVSCGNLLVREASRLFKPLKLSPAQFNVLHLLHLRGDGLRPSDIAQSLVVDPASMTYLMDTLEKRGWIQRGDDPKDRRVYRILLTKPGREMHDQAAKLYHAALASTASRLTGEHDAKAFQKLLTALPTAAAAATEDVLSTAPKPAAKRAKSR
jgi:DNA-binding MarR family transcriptional regulator